ncbi:MAG: S8 family serine peptidase [Anaerolineaceae bacterium]
MRQRYPLVTFYFEALSQRRILSPAESLNALTIGAIHMDESGNYIQGNRIDLMPIPAMCSPFSRFGYGFRRSIKPEIMFPGGRQLYRPSIDKNKKYFPVNTNYAPGQQVAWDSEQEGDLSKTVFTRGTSNATALATRNGARIYEVLSTLQMEFGEQIRENLISVLIKTLLVHGAQHDNQVEKLLLDSLKTQTNSRRMKEIVSRFIGYGGVDIERVLGCTEQRGTVLGCGEIHDGQIHEYRFPLPKGLSGTRVKRRMIITLAWFSPINPSHRNLREAKLAFQSESKWDESPLRLSRVDSDFDQVLRGTVQHEVLEGEKQILPYEEEGSILIQVTCKADATEKLDHAIPYGLAVTLEVAESTGIPIYEQIRARIRPKVAIDT